MRKFPPLYENFSSVVMYEVHEQNWGNCIFLPPLEKFLSIGFESFSSFLLEFWPPLCCWFWSFFYRRVDVSCNLSILLIIFPNLFYKIPPSPLLCSSKTRDCFAYQKIHYLHSRLAVSYFLWKFNEYLKTSQVTWWLTMNDFAKFL